MRTLIFAILMAVAFLLWAGAGVAAAETDSAADQSVPPPQVFGYIQFVGQDLLDDPAVRFKRARIYLDAPLSSDWRFQAVAQRVGGKWDWTEFNVGQSTKDWDYALGISTTAIGWGVPPPHNWALVTYPAATDLPYTSTGVFGRIKAGDATLRAAIVNGDDDLHEGLDALSFRLEVPTSDGRSTFGVGSYHGDNFGRDRKLLAADFHTGWDGGFTDAFYTWDDGSKPFHGGYWLVALGDQTKFIAEADYFKQPGADGEWAYALGVNHNLQTKTHKQSQLRFELRNAGGGEWIGSALLQVAVN